MDIEHRSGAPFRLMAHNGAIDDDSKWLSNLCNCSVRKLDALKKELVQGKFITVLDGKIYQKRALEEVKKAQERSEKASKNARKRHEKPPKTSGKSDEKEHDLNKNNDLGSASHQTPNTNTKDIPNGISKDDDELPDWLDGDIWSEYKKHRAEKKSKFTPTAEKRAIAKLEKWRTQGHDPTTIIIQSLEQGWTGLFELKTEEGQRNATNQSKLDAQSVWGLPYVVVR